MLIMDQKEVKILRFQLLKCEYFLVSLLLCDSNINIFELWTITTV